MNLADLFTGCRWEPRGFGFQGRFGRFLTFPNGSSFLVWTDESGASAAEGQAA